MKYTKVRNDFIERRDLSVTEKIILQYLYGRMRRDGQPWEVNSEQIRTALNLGRDATDKALSRLKTGGWLTDNRKAVRGNDGRIRREKSAVIESRRPEIVALDVSAGRTEHWKPGDGFPGSNKELSNEESSVTSPAMKPDVALVPDRSPGAHESGLSDTAEKNVTLSQPSEPSAPQSAPFGTDASSSSGDDLECRCECPSCRYHNRHNQCVFKCSAVAPWEAA